MPKIIFLPHEELCPDGAVVEANPGDSVLNVALANDIEVGDYVEIRECRPISKIVNFVVIGKADKESKSKNKSDGGKE